MYRVHFTIDGQVTPESERVLNALDGIYSKEDEFDVPMTPQDAGVFIDATCQALGICPLPVPGRSKREDA